MMSGRPSVMVFPGIFNSHIVTSDSTDSLLFSKWNDKLSVSNSFILTVVLLSPNVTDAFIGCMKVQSALR